VAEVRNSILNCVRYAIAVGARIVVPRILMREDYDKDNMRNATDFTYMFDMEYFLGALGASCPTMQMFLLAKQVYEENHFFGPVSLVPETLAKKLALAETSAEAWREAFQKWVSQYTDPQPIVIELGRTFLQYPVVKEGADFAYSFGSLLKFHWDIRNLATITMLKLSESFVGQPDLAQPILPDLYFGVHLSTVRDLSTVVSKVDLKYYTYEMQSKLFFEQASKSELSLVYVSSDDGADLVQFIRDAQALNLTVMNKFDLLKGWDRETLLELTPDQQAMIDYLILSKSSQFVGVGHSSFAWNIALQRHHYAEQKDPFDGPQMLSDEFSQIYGTPKARPAYRTSMWP
jgi:hypothetical protein